MADPTFQGIGTLDSKNGTSASSLSTTITNVQTGDLLVVQVQRNIQANVTNVASASPSLTFSLVNQFPTSGDETFKQGIYAAIATTNSESMTITASYSDSQPWGSIVSYRWSGGISSVTPPQTAGDAHVRGASTSRTSPDITTTARALLFAAGADWNNYNTHTAAANWTKILDSETVSTDSTTMFLHVRIANAGTYPNGDFATAASDQYFAGIAALTINESSIVIPIFMNQYRRRN